MVVAIGAIGEIASSLAYPASAYFVGMTGETEGSGNGSPISWGNESTLQDHFERHGSDFGAKRPNEYTQKANEFYNNRSKYKVKVDENGVIRIYDPQTNTFGSYNSDGTTRTFFKPIGGQNYFNSQPGK